MSEEDAPTPFEQGRRAAKLHPPVSRGGFGNIVIAGRPLGLNPHSFFTDAYDEWNDGYENAAAEILQPPPPPPHEKLSY